jgi:hypothetical protein
MGAIKLFMLDDWISFVSFGLQEDLDAVCGSVCDRMRNLLRERNLCLPLPLQVVTSIQLRRNFPDLWDFVFWCRRNITSWLHYQSTGSYSRCVRVCPSNKLRLLFHQLVAKF